MNTVERLKELSSLYDIREVLKIRHKRKLINCPLPSHNHVNYTPSFSIMDGARQKWKCHGSCNLHGDVIDLAGYLNVPGYQDKNIEHIELAIGYLDRNVGIREFKEPEPKRALQLSTWTEHEPYDSEIQAYFASRGIGKDALDFFDVRKHHGSAAIATFEEQRLTGIKYRKINNDGIRFFSAKGSRPGLFNYDGVFGTTEPVLILKSEITAIFMWQFGFKVCGFTGGENMDIPDRYLYPVSMAVKRVYVADNEPNKKAAEQVSLYAERRATILDAELHYPPDPYKDIDDWLNARPQDVEEVRRWMNSGL